MLKFTRWSVWMLGLLVGTAFSVVVLPMTGLARHPSRFIHNSPTSVKARHFVEIRGRIVQFDDLDYAEIRYRMIGSKNDFQIIRMTQRGQEHVGRFPGSIVLSPGIEYYVAGINFSGTPRLLAGSPASLLQFLVIDDGTSAPDPRTPPDQRPPDSTDPDRTKPDPDSSKPDSDSSKPDSSSGPSKDTPVGGKGEKLSRDLVVSSAFRHGEAVSMERTTITATVITAQDIRSYGWRSILDILRSVVGIDINDRGFDADIGMRGVNPLNNRGQGILFLLDGHDMSWRQLHQNFVNASWLSVDDIDRIEIIRGPMAAVWGRNAFHGVVHIITKKGQHIRGFSSLLGVGALSGTHFLQVRAGHQFASGLSLYATLSMHRELRSPVLSPVFEFLSGAKQLTYISPNDTSMGQNFYLKADWKGLFFTFHQSRYDATAPMNTYSLLGGDSRFASDRWIAHLGWKGKLSTWGYLRTWASFDRYTFDSGSRVVLNPLATNPANVTSQVLEAADNRLTLGSLLSASLHKFLQLQVGLQFEYLQMTMWHFPALFAQQIQGNADVKETAPNYGNARFDGFLQLLSPIGKWATIQAAARFSYDEHAGPRFVPQAGVVITPGYDLFIKAHYGMGVRSPSMYELFHTEFNRYGNPTVTDEEIHTIGLQVGWMRKKLMYVSLSGFFSMVNLPITYQTRQASQPLLGSEFFTYPTPKPTGDYRQLINREQGYTSLGVEIEARLFPISGFEMRGFFGLAVSSEVIDQDGNTDRLPYAAGLYGGLNATYRYRFFRVSLGLLYTGSKVAPVDPRNYPESVFNAPGTLPVKGLPNNDSPQPVPTWKADNSDHPRAPTAEDIPRADGYLRLDLTIQFLELFQHFDFTIRAQNILGLGLNAYDAGNPLLAPQKRFELMMWMRFRY